MESVEVADGIRSTEMVCISKIGIAPRDVVPKLEGYVA